MSEEVFFHYTNKEAAIKTVLQGKILPSALAENSNAVHGDGVYLTTLEPRHGETTIKNNNYLDGVAANKTNIEVHFEIMMPSSKVQRANDTRDIQVHKGPLLLSDHKWNLKTWAGEVLATQYFMISSDGKARESHNKTMGRYTLVKDICTMIKMNGKEVGRSFVYKHDEGNKYLYSNEKGEWCVGSVAGSNDCILYQPNPDNNAVSNHSPSKTIPWKYFKRGWNDDDKTLKVFPCFF